MMTSLEDEVVAIAAAVPLSDGDLEAVMARGRRREQQRLLTRAALVTAAVAIGLWTGGNLVGAPDKAGPATVTWTSTPPPPPNEATIAPPVTQKLSEGWAPVAGFYNGEVHRGRAWTVTYVSDGRKIVEQGPTEIVRGPLPPRDPQLDHPPTPDQQRQLDEIAAGKEFVAGVDDRP